MIEKKKIREKAVNSRIAFPKGFFENRFHFCMIISEQDSNVTYPSTPPINTTFSADMQEETDILNTTFSADMQEETDILNIKMHVDEPEQMSETEQDDIQEKDSEKTSEADVDEVRQDDIQEKDSEKTSEAGVDEVRQDVEIQTSLPKQEPRLKRTLETTNNAAGELLFCVCKSPEGEFMIMCDLCTEVCSALDLTRYSGTTGLVSGSRSPNRKRSHITSVMHAQSTITKWGKRLSTLSQQRPPPVPHAQKLARRTADYRVPLAKQRKLISLRKRRRWTKTRRKSSKDLTMIMKLKRMIN
jgi:hypothetical protein